MTSPCFIEPAGCLPYCTLLISEGVSCTCVTLPGALPFLRTNSSTPTQLLTKQVPSCKGEHRCREQQHRGGCVCPSVYNRP